MDKKYIIGFPFAIYLSLVGCQSHSVQGAYSTPNKKIDGVVLGITASQISAPLITGTSVLGSAVTGAHIGSFIGGMSEKNQLITFLSKNDVQIIQQGNKVKIIFSTNAYFYPQLPTLNPQKYRQLDYMAALLKKDKPNIIRISVYTDTIAMEDQANLLTQQRAESLLGYFWVHGIENKYLKAVGCGSQHPVANNETIQGRAFNRRVEITYTTSMN